MLVVRHLNLIITITPVSGGRNVNSNFSRVIELTSFEIDPDFERAFKQTDICKYFTVMRKSYFLLFRFDFNIVPNVQYSLFKPLVEVNHFLGTVFIVVL